MQIVYEMSMVMFRFVVQSYGDNVSKAETEGFGMHDELKWLFGELSGHQSSWYVIP